MASVEPTSLNTAGPRESEAPGIYDEARVWFGTFLKKICQ